MQFTRRRFLGALTGLAGAGAVGGYLAGSHIAASDAALAPSLPLDPPGSSAFKGMHILTAGRESERFATSPTRFSTSGSVLTDIDATTGRITQTLVPVTHAHQIIALPGRGELIIPPRHFPTLAITDLAHATLATIDAPEGFVFGGHGVLLPSETHIVFSMFDKAHRHKSRLVLFDIAARRFTDYHETSGTEAHDMALLDDNRTLAVGHYGLSERNTHDAAGYDPAQHRIEPSLSLIDCHSWKELSTTPLAINGTLAHICAGRGPDIYSVVESYLDARERTGNSTEAITARIASLMGTTPWSLSPFELLYKDVALPTPLFKFHRDHPAKHTTHFIDAPTQRRPQSLIYQRETGSVIIAYVYSDQLIALDAAGTLNAHPARSAGVPYPIGLSDIPGTPYFAAAGMMDNISLIDARSMRAVAHFPCHLFRSSHTTLYWA